MGSEICCKQGDGINERLEEEKVEAIVATPAPRFHEQLFGGILTHHHLWWLLVLAVNSPWVAFVFAGRSRAERGDLATTFALVNLLVAIAIRDGTLLLVLYKIVVGIPWQKYFFNRMLHCNGGIHTGCAMMVLFWTIVRLTMGVVTNKADTSDLIMLSLLCSGLFLMMILAVPAVRNTHHNVFERVHRYLGWSLLFLLAAILVKKFSSSHAKWRSTQAIVDSVLMLVSVEWHAFSVAFSDRQNRSYGLIVGVAGDWTKKLTQKCINENKAQVADEYVSPQLAIDLEENVEEGPRAAQGQRTINAWIRWHRPLGFMYSVYAYKRVICVGTGAGIAPILPHIGNQSTQMHVVWIAKNHRKIYGEEICNKVFQHPDHTIYDTGKQGRPQPEVALLPFEDFRAEAIFVVSNAPFTEAVRFVCRRRKIPAFGAVFDS